MHPFLKCDNINDFSMRLLTTSAGLGHRITGARTSLVGTWFRGKCCPTNKSCNPIFASRSSRKCASSLTSSLSMSHASTVVAEVPGLGFDIHD